MKNYINIISVIFLFCISQLYSQRDIIEIEYKANQDNSVNFNYKKKSPGNYFVMLKFSNLSNTRARYFNKVIKSNLCFSFVSCLFHYYFILFKAD